MGMVGGLTQLTPEELERVRRDPRLLPRLESEISEADASRTCELDKAWHGVHFLLVGDAGTKARRWVLPLYLAISAGVFIATAMLERILVVSGGEVASSVARGSAPLMIPPRITQLQRKFAHSLRSSLRSPTRRFGGVSILHACARSASTSSAGVGTMAKRGSSTCSTMCVVRSRTTRMPQSGGTPSCFRLARLDVDLVKLINLPFSI